MFDEKLQNYGSSLHVCTNSQKLDSKIVLCICDEAWRLFSVSKLFCDCLRCSENVRKRREEDNDENF